MCSLYSINESGAPINLNKNSTDLLVLFDLKRYEKSGKPNKELYKFDINTKYEKTTISKNLDRMVAKEKISEEDKTATLANISTVMKKNIILIIALIAIGIIGRIMPHPYNFTPIIAIALLSAHAIKSKWIAISGRNCCRSKKIF